MDGPDQVPMQPFHPFNSDLDWRVGQWAIKDSPGQNALDHLLSVPRVYWWQSCFVILLIEVFQIAEKLGLSFHNVCTLYGKIDAMPDRARVWQTKALSFRDLPGEEFMI